MDHQVETKEIARSLSFEVEAIPQDNSIQLTSSTNNDNPLNVKIKVRKKKDLDSPQNAVLSIPRFTNTKPERIRLASSDQTIISFNVYMEEADEKKIEKSKKKFFGLFTSGGAIDSQSSSPSKSENEIITENFTKLEALINETKSSRKDRGKGIFGKSKPGGCLDPPFGEDKYAYEAVKNMQSTSAPYQTQEVRLKEKDSLNLKIDSINKLKPIKKKTSFEDGTSDDKTSKTEKSSVLSLFQADSFKPPLEISYSNSIITYPPPLTSSEMRVFNAVNEKNLKNKSSVDKSSFQDPTDRYFGPKRESGSRKSSKIEGIKEGDKGPLLAPEQTKDLRNFDKNLLETKYSSSKNNDDYLNNKFIRDAMLPVAGGLISSTLLHSPSEEKLKRDSLIATPITEITDLHENNAIGNKEIPNIKLKPTEDIDRVKNEIFKDSMLPVSGGLIAATLSQVFTKEKLKQDGIVDAEKTQVSEPNKDKANENKEIPKVEREPPDQKDQLTNETSKDSPVTGALTASMLPPTFFSKEKLKQDRIVDPENSQVLDPNKDGDKEILKVTPEPLKIKDNSTNEILKDIMLPVAGGLIASTLPQAFVKENLNQDRIIDPDISQAFDANKESTNGNKKITKVELEPLEKKDGFTNEIFKDSRFPNAGSLIALTLPQVLSKEKLTQDITIDSENSQVPDQNKYSANEKKDRPKVEQELPNKIKHLTNKISKDSMLAVAGGLIASTVPQVFSKEKLKQDNIIEFKNAQITDPIKDVGKNNEKVLKVEENYAAIGDITVLPLLPSHGKEKSPKEMIATENDQIPDTNDDRAIKNNNIPKFEQESAEKIDFPKNEVLQDKMIPVAEGLMASSQLKSESTENIKEEKIIGATNAHIGKDKDVATEEDEIQKVQQESLEKLPLDFQEQSKNDKVPIETTTSSVLTKLPHVLSTKSDELQEKHRKSLKETNSLLLVENNIGPNKESKEVILKPDLLTRHEESSLIPVSTENGDIKYSKTAASYLLEKDSSLKDDSFLRDEQSHINKTLDAEEVDADMSIQNAETEPRLEKQDKEDSVDNTLKERGKIAYKEPVVETDLVLDDVTENTQPKKTVPSLNDEIKLPEDNDIKEQHTKLVSSFEDLFSNDDVLWMPPDEDKDKTKTDTSQDTLSVQALSKLDYKIEDEQKEFEKFFQLREENQKLVPENKGEQYIANIQSQSKEKLIISEQGKRLQSEPLDDISLKVSEVTDALRDLGVNEDLPKEVSNRDIQKRAKLESRDEGSYLFDNSFSRKPAQFSFPEEDNSKLENIVNESNPNLTKQENKVIVLNIAFQSYVNEENKRVFRSVDDSNLIERFNDDRIVSFKSVVEPDGMEIRIPIDPDNDLSLNILKKGNSTSESRKILKIQPEIYTDTIKGKKSKSTKPAGLTEEINRNNYESKSDNVEFKLQKGLEKHEQQLESKLVTRPEKLVKHLESTLVTDGEQTRHRPEPKLVTTHQKPDQQLELPLTTDRVKQDHQPEFKTVLDNKKSDQQRESKLVTSWEKQDYQPEVKLVTDRKKPDKQLVSRREKLGIEPDSSIRARDIYSLHRTLSSVYEQHLVPLQDLIKSLKQEIDSLASQQELLRHNLLGVTKIKSMRVHASKKCICQRKP